MCVLNGPVARTSSTRLYSASEIEIGRVWALQLLLTNQPPRTTRSASAFSFVHNSGATNVEDVDVYIVSAVRGTLMKTRWFVRSDQLILDEIVLLVSLLRLSDPLTFSVPMVVTKKRKTQ